MAQYGKDETGLRRIWPFEVGAIDLAGLRADREQIWAEAVKLYDDGVSWWVDGNRVVIDPEETPKLAPYFSAPVTERALFDRQAEDRMQIDAWQYPIAEWWSQNNGLPYVTTSDVLTDALKIERSRWTKPEQMRVAAILVRMGFTHGKAGKRNARMRVFFPPSEEKQMLCQAPAKPSWKVTMICPSDHARSELMLRIGVCGRPVCEVVLQVGHGEARKQRLRTTGRPASRARRYAYTPVHTRGLR
ncbi:VapE domain-containing protein [Propionivibrio sp.]|uniref:VapE domain-containing protein n=1 Tax=Propionivibrio sp. TaxID=2212460 RepID=UPI0025FADE66|nr:VapE domain-containing protein [Propionivibrio sp.]MBK7356326.1 hypothetical protein [Propionivibrio sp.]